MYTTNDYEFEMDVLASYLVSLFYKSKKNYSCTRQKIFKLLALNSLCNINHPELLNTLYVDDEIITTKDPSLVLFINRDVYIRYPFCDDKKKFLDQFDEDVKIPNMFNNRLNRCELDVNSKKILEDIFRNFASYPIGDLIKMINEILPLIKEIVKTKNYILKESNYLYNHYKKEKYELIFSYYNTNEKYKDNEVFLFLKKNILNQIGNKKDKYDLEDITNYIIHLYDKIEGEYFCNHLKIKKIVLLAIYDYYKKNNKLLINDVKVINDDIVGLIIDTKNTYIRTPITNSKLISNDVINHIAKKELEEYRESKIFGFDESIILNNESVKNSLIDTFLKYASYDTKELDNVLNEKVNKDFFENNKAVNLNEENISKMFKFDKNLSKQLIKKL